MNHFWERIRDMYLNPAVGIPAVVREGVFPEALRIVMVAAVVTTIVSYGESVQTDDPLTIGISLLLVFFSIAMWYFSTGISYIIAKALGGHGKYRTLLTATGYASYMSVVLGVIDMFLILVRAPEIVGSILGFVFFVWMFAVEVFVLREVMRVSTGKAIVITLIPLAIVLFIAILLLTAYAAGGGHIPG